MSDNALGSDPLRAELDARWNEYLEAGVGQPDHDEWMLKATSAYCDEIVHYGAQLLNDCLVRPWNPDLAAASYDDYVRTGREYDHDPVAWERAFWDRARSRPR